MVVWQTGWHEWDLYKQDKEKIMPETANAGTKHRDQIWAIYHPLELAVAETLAKAGEVDLVPPSEVPQLLQLNNLGEPVLGAMVIRGNKLARVHQVLAAAYAE
jgi:hypothetical protein